MTDHFGRPTKSVCLEVLRKILVTLACLVFLLSFISPFYWLCFISLGVGDTIQFWSYKDCYQDIVHGVIQPIRHQTWFVGYWFTDLYFVTLVNWILMFMFILQALTLAFGVASIISNKRLVSFAPVPLSLAVLALMIWTSMILSPGRFLALVEYQLGFYLVFPSIALFFSAFILGVMIKREKQTDPTKGNNTNSEELR